MVLTGVCLYNYPTLQGAVAILTILVYALAVVHYNPYQESWMVRSGFDSTPPSTNSSTNDRMTVTATGWVRDGFTGQ